MKRPVLMAVVLSMAAWHHASAQAVSGRIFDDITSCPLRGVTMSVPGTAVRTVTDAGGRYRLKGVPSAPFTLQAALAGYAAQTTENVVASDTAMRVDFSLTRAPADTAVKRPPVRYPPATCVLDRRDSAFVR